MSWNLSSSHLYQADANHRCLPFLSSWGALGKCSKIIVESQNASSLSYLSQVHCPLWALSEGKEVKACNPTIGKRDVLMGQYTRLPGSVSRETVEYCETGRKTLCVRPHAPLQSHPIPLVFESSDTSTLSSTQSSLFIKVQMNSHMMGALGDGHYPYGYWATLHSFLS